MAVDMRTEEDIYTQRGMPRSALRHRPVHPDEKVTVLTPRASRGRYPEVQERPYEESEYQTARTRVPHQGSRARRNALPGQQYVIAAEDRDSLSTRGGRPSRQDRPAVPNIADYKCTKVSPQRSEQASARRRTIVVLMLGAVAALIVIMLTNALISWWQGVMDNIHYGYPRTSQLDAVVGHNDSPTNETHFIFLNLHGHVEIIEIPGGDASHARIFTGPTLIGAGQDLIPITGEIRNEDGRLDLIVHIQNQQLVYVNDGSTFHQQ